MGGPPYIVSVHGSDVALFQTRHWVDRTLIRWALEGASEVVAVSQSLADEARQTFSIRTPISVVHNGLESTVFEETSSSTTAGPGLPPRFILLVGGFVPEKGVDIALRALMHLPYDVAEVPLVVIGGSGNRIGNREFCERLTAELLPPRRVIFVGAQPREYVLNAMRLASAVVIPSRREGFAGVLLEAGALGRAVVCTDIPAFREVIETEVNGLVVPLDDSEQMAAALTRLLRDAELCERIGGALRRCVQARFTAEAMADGFRAAYQRAVEAPRAYVKWGRVPLPKG